MDVGDDLADLDALIENVDPCTGPDYTDFVNLVRMVKHMRRLIGALTKPEREG